MALYNFKKIMVVPTAKVRFSRRVYLLTGRYFTRFMCQVWGEKIFKKGEGTIVGRKHVSSSRLQLLVKDFNVVNALVSWFYSHVAVVQNS